MCVVVVSVEWDCHDTDTTTRFAAMKHAHKHTHTNHHPLHAHSCLCCSWFVCGPLTLFSLSLLVRSYPLNLSLSHTRTHTNHTANYHHHLPQAKMKAMLSREKDDEVKRALDKARFKEAFRRDYDSSSSSSSASGSSTSDYSDSDDESESECEFDDDSDDDNDFNGGSRTNAKNNYNRRRNRSSSRRGVYTKGDRVAPVPKPSSGKLSLQKRRSGNVKVTNDIDKDTGNGPAPQQAKKSEASDDASRDGARDARRTTTTAHDDQAFNDDADDAAAEQAAVEEEPAPEVVDYTKLPHEMNARFDKLDVRDEREKQKQNLATTRVFGCLRWWCLCCVGVKARACVLVWMDCRGLLSSSPHPPLPLPL